MRWRGRSTRAPPTMPTGGAQGSRGVLVAGLPPPRGPAGQPPRRHGRARPQGAGVHHAPVTASLARLVFPALRWRRGSFAHERAKIDQTLAAGVGGFILFGGTREAVATLTPDLRAQAGRPLLVGADLERGARQPGHGLTELPPAAALGALG